MAWGRGRAGDGFGDSGGETDEAALEWLAEQIRPGERIRNNANDRSTLAYVRHALRILNTVTRGTEGRPESIELLKNFDDYRNTPEVRSILRDKNIRWFYVRQGRAGRSASMTSAAYGGNQHQNPDQHGATR